MTKLLICGGAFFFLVACYSVDYPESYRCSNDTAETRSCPAGYVCSGTRCVPEGSQLDGAVDTGPPEDGALPKEGGPSPDGSQSDQGPQQTLAQIYAGTGSAGTSDGTATTAQFDTPGGVFVDSSGVVYVADTSNHCIRRIANDANHTVTTIAGKCGEAGAVNGPVASARFRSPVGIIRGSQGQLVVADTLNHCIRVINNGAVSTLAGLCQAGLGGNQDGAVTAARFRAPYAVMFTAGGDLLVADTGNHCLRIIKAGQVSPYAGTCNALLPGTKDGQRLTTAKFHDPSGIWLDKAQNRIVVADSKNSCVREIKGDQVTTIAGVCNGQIVGFADGPATTVARFNLPSGITVSPEGVLVSDSGNHRLRLIANNTVTSIAGNGVAGSALGPADNQPVFNTPGGVVPFGPGKALVADTKNHRILVLAPIP